MKELNEKSIGGVQRAKFQDLMNKAKEFGGKKRAFYEHMEKLKAEFEKLKSGFQECVYRAFYPFKLENYCSETARKHDLFEQR
jgi:hypothetical protein